MTYDLTNLATLDGVEYYKQELENNGPEDMSKKNSNINFFFAVINLVGNKRDLVNLKESDNEDIQEFAKVLFFLTLFRILMVFMFKLLQ